MTEEFDSKKVERISQRIFYFLENENLSDADFAASIGVGASVISHLKSGRNKVSLNVYAKILESYPKLNPHWLLKGDGNMYNEGSEKSISATSNELNLFTNTNKQVKSTEASFEKKEVDNSMHVQPLETKTRNVAKIIVFYTDGSFQELTP